MQRIPRCTVAALHGLPGPFLVLDRPPGGRVPPAQLSDPGDAAIET